MKVMKSIIFDMDGVIINSSLVYAKAIRKSLSKRGYNFSIDHILARIIAHIGNWVDAVLPENAEDRNEILEEIVEEVKEGIAEASRDVKYQKDIEKTLEKLGKGNELYLITNSGSKLTEKVLEGNNLKRFFKRIITSDDGFGTKEKAIAYLIDGYGLKKAGVIYVGDTEKDVKCARETGCKIIILYTPFSWDYGKYEKIKSAKPHMIVKSLDKLAEALREV